LANFLAKCPDVPTLSTRLHNQLLVNNIVTHCIRDQQHVT